MTNTTLIPGNRYIHKRNKDVVIFVGCGMHQEPIFQNIFSKYIYSEDAVYYIPYIPPVVHTHYLCWYKDPIGKIGSTVLPYHWDHSNMKKCGGYKLLSETVVTYTEEK